MGAHQQVGEAVPVDVAGRRDGATGVIVPDLADELHVATGRGRKLPDVHRAEDQPRRSCTRPSRSVVDGPEQDVAAPVAVAVGDARDGDTEVVTR